MSLEENAPINSPDNVEKQTSMPEKLKIPSDSTNVVEPVPATIKGHGWICLDPGAHLRHRLCHTQLNNHIPGRNGFSNRCGHQHGVFGGAFR